MSTWFAWHAHRIRPGMRVLDVAGGEGRHALAAAKLGASVVLLDRDSAAIESARGHARAAGLSIDARVADLEGPWPELGVFDAVLVFNYLDRLRLGEVIVRVAPDGLLIMETFLEAQRAQGWGPTRPEHLLEAGELARLVVPLTVLYGREVLEPVDTSRWRAVASIVAQHTR